MNSPWPPLITAAEQPALMRWRDRLLTLGMWLVLFVMLGAEFELLIDHTGEFLGRPDPAADPHWEKFHQRLAPYVVVIAILVLFLTASAVATRIRLARARRRPLPAPLEAEAAAARERLSLDDLLAARTLRRAVVHIGDEGEVSVEPVGTEAEMAER